MTARSSLADWQPAEPTGPRQHRPDEVANYNEFALLTGLRPSERIALVWGDVDWNRRTVQVERSRVLAEVKPAKT